MLRFNIKKKFMLNNILIIGGSSRKDYLEPFDKLKGKINMFFLTHYSPKEKTITKEYGEEIFWSSFSSGFELLKTLQIKKIIFYEFESYNDIALRVAAIHLKIICCHLEHGYQDYSNEYFIRQNNSPLLFKTKIHEIPFLSYIKLYFKNRFYYETYLKSNYDLKKQLLMFYKLRSRYHIENKEKFENLKLSLLKLDFYISFSSENFKFVKILHHLGNDFKDYKFIGFPNSDYAFKLKKTTKFNTNKLLFIDQPFFEYNLYGWTRRYKSFFLKDLKSLAEKKGLDLVIKPHPSNDMDIYKNMGYKMAYDNIFNNYSYVIGFNSAILFPISAIPNMLLFCLNNHPKPFKNIENNVFVKGKVAIGLNQLSEFSKDLLERKILEKDRKIFIKKYMYKFDGKSKDRLTKIILS